jgi:prepilin-type N-terminal cleavage/methylation domain-containing protein
MHLASPTPTPRPAHRRGGLRRGREGMTLIEIAVVIAIILMIGAVALPALNGFLLMEQSAAAKNLGITFKYLRDEAALRNVTFRVAFDLDKRTYEVQVGDPRTLIFLTPDERVAYEDALEDKLASTTEREREEGRRGRRG